MAANKAQIISEIYAAFGRDKPPVLLVKRHEVIWKHREVHKNREELDVIKLFMGRPWWEVDSAYAYEGRAAGDLEMAYSYLLPEAFAYYLPALFLLAIEFLETPRQQEAYAWVEQLEHNLDPDFFRKKFSERILQFTPEQKTAIAHALRYIETAGGEGCVAAGILQYWSQFE